MTRRALLDAKVCYERGEGGAPKELSEWMELLFQDYKEAETRLKRLVFNSGVLDLKLPEREKRVVPEDVEEQMDKITKKKKITLGGLLKWGVHMTNTYTALEA